MNARQAKKYRKKVVVPFFMMDEMCLISMTEEEQKEYFKARKKFMERYCQYKHYRDKGNIGNIRQKYYDFPWPVAKKDKEMWEGILKRSRKREIIVPVSPADKTPEILRKFWEQIGLGGNGSLLVNSPYAIFTHHAKSDDVIKLAGNIREIAIQEEFDLSQEKEIKSIPVTRRDTYQKVARGYVNEFVKSDTEQPCCVCHKMTNLIEMDKASVTGKRGKLF